MRACAARSLTAYFDAGQVLFGQCILVRGTLKKRRSLRIYGWLSLVVRTVSFCVRRSQTEGADVRDAREGASLQWNLVP